VEVIQIPIQYANPDTFYLYPFSDAHLGSIESAEHALERKVIECANRGRLGLAVGIGDWCDCITNHDKRFQMNGLAKWVEPGNIVQSQRERAVEIFKPLTEQKQLLAVGTGNHEETIHRFHNDDITRNICKDLKVPYAGYHTFIILKFIRSKIQRFNLVIHMWHGAGAAQTEGARVMRLVRLVNEIQADVYLMGHLHAMTSHTPDRLYFQNGEIKSKRLAATITGSWLETYHQSEEGQTQDPTYGEEKGYKPSSIGCPIIRIKPANFEQPGREVVAIES